MMIDTLPQVWEGKAPPRVLVGAAPDSEKGNMQVVAVRFTLQQIAVMDGFAHKLHISRAKFLREFFAQMLNLPGDAK